MKWELEEGGTLGAGAELEPVQFPRSDANRGQSDDNNKGAASVTDSIASDRARNVTGNEQSPRHDGDVDYGVGPYPAIDDNTEGVDEIGGSQ